jgi:hypothetical protein
MLGPYIDFVSSLFPAINPYTQKSAKKALEQFYQNGKEFKCFTTVHFDGLCQGDIINELPFSLINDDDEIYELKRPAIIISNSCDIENDEMLLAAPLIDIEELSIDETTLRNNRFFRLLYFPDEVYKDYVVDLGLISPFPIDKIDKAIREGKIIRSLSLNLVGYYLLISKITVHLLRPEDSMVQSLRLLQL